MSITTQLIDLMARAPDAKVIVLDPRTLSELKKELTFIITSHIGGTGYFGGLPIVTRVPTAFCRNCGADVEPNVCSYCKTPSSVIELR